MNKKMCEQRYALALMLFKQLKVLHRLPRTFAKILRIASYMYDLGRNVNNTNHVGNNYNAIISAPIMGCTHKDLTLAAFVASCNRWEDFNLSEWIRYKDMMTDEDLDAVKKLSNIVALADVFNIRNQEIIKDISCDILGDSVILKLMTDPDPKNVKVDPTLTEVEIFSSRKFSGEFTKAFKKTLEVL